jgi:acyl-CoA thioester hydrolase
MKRRKQGGYFSQREGDPDPIVVEISSRVRFNECDVMGVVWFGHYMRYFEEGSAAIGRKCGMSFSAFREARIKAPIVQCHTDYHKPLLLEDEYTIRATLYYSEAAVIEKEYQIIKADGTLAASGYTVQLLMDKDNRHIALSPPLLQKCRERWRDGEFHDRNQGDS